jgi:PhzF family phenazine biosynthesis protein
MRKYHLYQIDAFTKEKLLGNPAGVITNADGLTEPEMQRIARELNNSETAFILPPTDETHDVHVRFFTPQNEVPICGHATIAAHYARAVENHFDTVRVYQKTGAGILPVDIIREDNDYRIVMTQGKITFGDRITGEPLEMLLPALGISVSDLRTECPICIASTGHSKVMIGIRDIGLLHRLNPNMELLTKVSKMIGCNGFYVFTLHPDEKVLVHGRMFAPAIGINEDPVTGNANGPLGAYLVHFGLSGNNCDVYSFTAMQGEAIHRTGTMEVQVEIENNEPVEVKIVGNATIAFSAELTLS